MRRCSLPHSASHLIAVVIASAAGIACSSSDAPAVAGALSNCPGTAAGDAGSDAAGSCQPILGLISEGQTTFRRDTFGDEAYWTGSLKLNTAVEGSAHGGVGLGLSPNTALSVGLKLDAESLPIALVDQLRAGQVNLDDPATTLALLDLDAIIGVKATLSADKGSIVSLGITCALCHSTVDDSFSPGIGKRLDGWANRDLNMGAIISLAPDLSAMTALLGVDEATVRQMVGAWGPGKFDAQLILDGKGFRPDGTTAATLIPPAYGLAGVNLTTYTGWGSISYWNAFSAVLEMHGSGSFSDSRLDDATRFPVAARAMLGEVAGMPDLVTSKLAGLHVYQLSLLAPLPAAGSFDAVAASRGQTVFNGVAKCATCHVPPLFTDAGWSMHSADEMGIDDFQALRSPDEMYRTTPLRGLVNHGKGGYYHDGRFASLRDVVDHYDVLGLGLSDAQKSDLVAYLESL